MSSPLTTADRFSSMKLPTERSRKLLHLQAHFQGLFLITSVSSPTLFLISIGVLTIVRSPYVFTDTSMKLVRNTIASLTRRDLIDENTPRRRLRFSLPRKPCLH